MKISNLSQGYYFGRVWFIQKSDIKEYSIFSEYLLNMPFHIQPLENTIRFLGGEQFVTELLSEVLALEIWLEMSISIFLVTKMLLSVS